MRQTYGLKTKFLLAHHRRHLLNAKSEKEINFSKFSSFFKNLPQLFTTEFLKLKKKTLMCLVKPSVYIHNNFFTQPI